MKDPILESGSPQPRLRVVVVEDDQELREAILVPALIEAGNAASGVGSAGALYRALLNGRPDIVVLDIGLPDESGLEVARHLRATSALGIILLTSRTAVADRVRGLDLGADAYLPKPIDPDVLCATVRSLARRLQPPAERAPRWALEADGWRLDAPHGAALPLSSSERAVLQRLFATPGVPVPRDALIAGLTDDAYTFDPHRLDMLVHRLRRKLTEAGLPVLPLRAVRGVGYVLVPEGGDG